MEKPRVLSKKVIGLIAVMLGAVSTIYGIAGIERFGFYLSPRYSVGQTSGGLAPYFLFIGIISIAYGVIELVLNRHDRSAEGRGSRRATNNPSGPDSD